MAIAHHGSTGEIPLELLPGLAPLFARAEPRVMPVMAEADLAHDADSPYRAFLEAIGVAVYTTDAQGRITFFNDAAATFWGRRPALGELWCGSLRIFRLDGSPLPHDECPMAVALKEGRIVRGVEAIVERPDGSRAVFIPYPTPLRDTDGRLIGGVNVLIDVTERQRAVDDLRSTAEALRESNAVKDEFLGLVSHELRTPVTTIFGNARLLSARGDQLDADRRRSMVADIATDSDRLLGIVENLLLLTRIGTGAGASLDLEPQALGHVVARAVHAYRNRHHARPISIRSERQHLVVEADRTYLDLIVENLISNADKYSPDGSEIEVVVELAEAEAHVVVLDRGIGIGEEQADRLFAPFYRSHEARAKAHGLGIGLAVCRRLVQAQGGRMWARTRAGGGSEFGFALPLAPEPDDNHAAIGA